VYFDEPHSPCTLAATTNSINNRSLSPAAYGNTSTLNATTSTADATMVPVGCPGCGKMFEGYSSMTRHWHRSCQANQNDGAVSKDGNQRTTRSESSRHSNSQGLYRYADEFLEVSSDETREEEEEKEEEEVFFVESILNERVKAGRRQFLVRWHGYTALHDSWEPLENVASNIVFQQYEAAQLSSADQTVKQVAAWKGRHQHRTMPYNYRAANQGSESNGNGNVQNNTQRSCSSATAPDELDEELVKVRFLTEKVHLEE